MNLGVRHVLLRNGVINAADPLIMVGSDCVGLVANDDSRVSLRE